MVNRLRGSQNDVVTELFSTQFGDKEMNGVEIGTRTGILTSALLDKLPTLKHLWTIDPWEYREGEQYEAGRDLQVGHDNSFQTAIATLCQGNLYARGRLAILYMSSDDAVGFIPWRTVPIDFVWIDGDHSPHQVEKDVVNYRAIVRSGGLIGGHDFGTKGPVKAIVEGIFHPDEINLGVATCWWVLL